jgi:hypothetical protein
MDFYKTLVLIIAIGLFSLSETKAQTFKIRGTVIDTTAFKKINKASVVILNAKDSIIFKDVRTSNTGEFIASNFIPGQYILLVTYPGYVDFVKPFNVSNDATLVDFGQIKLTPLSQFLKEVLVKAKKTPIRLRGDTVEFDAQSYRLQPNASVEDLLKRLPGLQVDNYGNITAQARRVTKVLVDGEEFFGDDPTLVTRNLRADMIDKVQLYDKKSDQAKFTGVDDGIKQKTINLKLKDDKKIGSFGKAEVGIATNRYYQGNLMYNYFNHEEKFAIYGLTNNIGSLGLSRKDKDIYSAGNDNIDLGNRDLDPWNGEYSGQGIPKVIYGGIHYNNKWDNGKRDINSNYTINDLNVDGQNQKEVQENLPDRILYTKSKQEFKNSILKNAINSHLKLQLDSTSELNITIKGGVVKKTTNNKFTTATFLESGTLLNQNDRTFTTTGNNQAFDGDLLWMKKFKKPRRTLTIDVNQYDNYNNSNGFLNSNSYLSLPNQRDTINQYKVNKNHSSIFSSKITYTEPISESSTLFLTFGVSVNKESSTQNSYNILTSNLLRLDSLYSNQYDFNQSIKASGVKYNYQKGKLRIDVGSDFSNNDFKQVNVFKNSILKRTFLLWYPRVSATIDFTNLKNLSITYSGNTSIPNLQQLQPYLNNIDPLNIFQGNVNLKPSFSNNYSVNYFGYETSNSTMLSINGSYTTISHPITQSVLTDNSGLSIYKYVNMEGKQNKNYSANVAYSFPTKFYNIGLYLESGFDGNVFHNITNGEINTARSNSYHFSMSMGTQKADLYNVGIGLGADYNTNYNSLSVNSNNNFWGMKVSPNFDFYLPKKIQIHSEAEYIWKQKTQAFDTNFSRLIWSSWIGKNFFKDNSFAIRLTVNDILNQNTGFDRSTYNNFISQNTYTTIRRYFMLSAIYNLNHFKKS